MPAAPIYREKVPAIGKRERWIAFAIVAGTAFLIFDYAWFGALNKEARVGLILACLAGIAYEFFWLLIFAPPPLVWSFSIELYPHELRLRAPFEERVFPLSEILHVRPAAVSYVIEESDEKGPFDERKPQPFFVSRVIPTNVQLHLDGGRTIFLSSTNPSRLIELISLRLGQPAPRPSPPRR